MFKSLLNVIHKNKILEKENKALHQKISNLDIDCTRLFYDMSVAQSVQDQLEYENKNLTQKVEKLERRINELEINVSCNNTIQKVYNDNTHNSVVKKEEV